jgi:hypothetical protein
MWAIATRQIKRKHVIVPFLSLAFKFLILARLSRYEQDRKKCLFKKEEKAVKSRMVRYPMTIRFAHTFLIALHQHVLPFSPYLLNHQPGYRNVYVLQFLLFLFFQEAAAVSC